MEQELISKKELLELTGISYGQLYRWKRKKLIPEDWFIRKSTFTGQETFFQKEKILGRIAKIMDMKEDSSLDDLADVFSPTLAQILLSRQELLERAIVSNMALEALPEQLRADDTFTFDKILCVYVFDKLLQAGEISLEEGHRLLQTILDHYEKFEGQHCELIFVRKMGISIFLLTLSASEIYFENNTKVVARLSLTSCIEELKIKIGSV